MYVSSVSSVLYWIGRSYAIQASSFHMTEPKEAYLQTKSEVRDSAH